MTRYTYEEAETIIGWPRATIAHHAWKLGLARVGGGLDDNGLQAVWEAIEARAQVAESTDTAPDVEASPKCPEPGRECSSTPGAKSSEPLDMGPGTPSAKCAERLIIREGEGEPTVTAPHFSGIPNGAKTSSRGPFPDDDSPPGFRDVRAPDTDRTRINAMALRELDVTIEVRELELRTLRRARAALAGDVERDESAVPCGDGAQVNA
jgi:hypothetical protein